MLVLLGTMTSMIDIIPWARLRQRPVQLYVLALWRPIQQSLNCLIPVRPALRYHLMWWQEERNLLAGVQLATPPPDMFLFTDASTIGWGAHLDNYQAAGLWSPQDKNQHINWLELQAVFLALQKFEHIVTSHHVLVNTDNTTVVAYINKSGGNKIPNPMLSVMGSNDLVPGEGHKAESSSPPRQTKSHCGCSIAQQTSASYRMVSPTRGGQPSFPPVADTHNGLVRDIQKPQTPSVCVPSTGPQSGSSGCSVHVMEGINSVRFPSPSSPSPGITQNSGRGDDNDPSCPPVAQQVMVSNTVGTTDTESPRTTVTRGSTISGGRPGSSGPRRLPPSRIQVVEQALLKKGFSKSTAAIIARPQRTSTLAAYEDKWQKFVDWCDKRQITPINASCSQLAEFFLFLFKEKEFSPKTKAVYRSAIAATIKSLGGGGFRSQQYLISYDKELYD